MFITQHYLAFSGWPELRLLLSLKDLSGIEKSNTLYYIPNAIQVNSNTYGDFFFGSFVERDVCFGLLSSMSLVAKRLVEIKIDGKIEPAETRELIFGLRTVKGAGMTYLGDYVSLMAAQAKAISTTYQGQGHALTNANNSDENQLNSVVISDAISGAVITNNAEVAIATDNRSVPSSKSNKMELGANSSRFEAESNVEDGINLEHLFLKFGIQPLCSHELPFCVSDVWRSCWLSGGGYG
jgi:hypothetical protein